MRYGWRDITDVTLRSLTTNQPEIYMNYLQTSSQSIGTEIQYLKAGRGAPKRIGFQSGNSMNMEMKSGLITPELLGLMFGVKPVKGVQNVPVTEVITASTPTFNISATPITTDLTAYPITVSYAPDGTAPEVSLTKVVSATPATDEFSISNTAVTVNSTTYASGGTFLVTYYKASTDKNKRIQYQTDRFAGAYKLTGYTLWKNEEDGLSYPCRITIPKLQITIDGNTLESVMEGDATAPVLKGEALAMGTEKDLIIYDVDEGEGLSGF